MDVSDLTLKQASEKLGSGELSSKELLEAYLDRIEEQNSGLNALLNIDHGAAAAAKAIDDRRAAGEELGPLAGIPVILKDNFLVEGWHATAGSKILENHVAAYDATVSARLRAAGAVLLGRSNMDEFAMGSSTENSHYGPTRNPWDVERVPGGSSGGSAAAMSAGFAPIALGSDTGGSIRQPASLCGITGLKPTYGRVSRFGLIALASSLDQIGTFTRTAEDAAMVMRAIEGPDPRDATSAPLPDQFEPELAEPTLKGLRIGLPKEFFGEGLDENVRAIVMDAVKRMESEGAVVKEIELPHAPYALAAYYLIMPSEASSNLARFDGVRYGHAVSADSLQEAYAVSRAEGFGPEAKRRVMLGTYALSAGYRDAFYRKALKVRTLVRRDYDEAFKEVDVVAGPTSPTVAWKIGEKADDPLAMYLSDIYTVSVNLAGLPGISLPCGFAEGLPVGLQLIGKSFDEASLYRAGMAYQAVTDWHKRTPNAT